jgi:hypothetical protein
MLRASALFIVLVVAFVVGAITSSIVFATFYYRLEVSDLLLYKKLNTNLNSVIAELKVMPEEQLRDSIVWDLYQEGEDSVCYTVKPWGVFEVAQVAAFFNAKRVQKTCMFGYTLGQESKAALCLSDSDRGLRLSGKTIIVGDCYLPQGVVKTSNVDGQFYQGPPKLVDGQIFKSPKTTVPLNEDMLKYLADLLKTKSDTYTLTDKDTALINSFVHPTYCVDYQHGLLQALPQVKGNVILYSTKPIVLRKSQRLEDVIIVAPSVTVPEEYQGVLQIICTDSIVVKERVRLKYPSALILVKNKNTTPLAYISLFKDAEVRGVVCAYSEFVNEEQVVVNIFKGATVHGQVYSNAHVNCQGTVKGGIISRKLLLKTAVSINENCLLDATIDVSKRSPAFVGSKLLPVSKQRGIVKWL